MIKDYIIEEITYANGGKLIIYKSGKKEYNPSESYFKYLKSIEYNKPSIPLEEKEKIIQSRKLLFNKNICLSGNKLLNNFLYRFNFTNQLKNFKRKNK